MSYTGLLVTLFGGSVLTMSFIQSLIDSLIQEVVWSLHSASMVLGPGVGGWGSVVRKTSEQAQGRPLASRAPLPSFLGQPPFQPELRGW